MEILKQELYGKTNKKNKALQIIDSLTVKIVITQKQQINPVFTISSTYSCI